MQSQTLHRGNHLIESSYACLRLVTIGSGLRAAIGAPRSLS